MHEFSYELHVDRGSYIDLFYCKLQYVFRPIQSQTFLTLSKAATAGRQVNSVVNLELCMLNSKFYLRLCCLLP